MTETGDTGETVTANDGGGRDPRQAARILEETKRDAQRKSTSPRP